MGGHPVCKQPQFELFLVPTTKRSWPAARSAAAAKQAGSSETKTISASGAKTRFAYSTSAFLVKPGTGSGRTYHGRVPSVVD